MPFTQGKMQWASVVVLARQQRWALLGQTLPANQITIPTSTEHIPNIGGRSDEAAVQTYWSRRFHFIGLDHVVSLVFANRKISCMKIDPVG
jgi:hypothetical protein